jgi:CRISPR-associated RAMP protein, csm5 family
MEKYESKQIELTCISPVHIGSGVKLLPFEYLYDRRRRDVFFVDEGKFSALLMRHQLIDDFVADMRQRRRPYLMNWLTERRISEREIQGITLRRAKVHIRQDERSSLNDVACLETLSDGRPYIPGSSLKGAIRCAVVYHLLRQPAHENLRREYWGKLQEAMNARNIKAEIGKTAKKLEEELLCQLKYADEKGRYSDAAMRDVMRGLRIGDAMPTAKRLDTEVIQKIDVSTHANKSGRKEHGISLFRECIPMGSKFRFQITVEKEILAQIGIRDIEGLIRMCRTYTASGIAMQERSFGRDYRAEFDEAGDADIMLGGGTGFLSKTIFYALAPTEEIGRKTVAVLLDQLFQHPAHYHRQKDTVLSPRTLKLTWTDTDSSIMGLCTLQEVAPC